MGMGVWIPPPYRLDTWPLSARAGPDSRAGGRGRGRFTDGLATLAAGLLGMGIGMMVLVIAMTVLFVVTGSWKEYKTWRVASSSWPSRSRPGFCPTWGGRGAGGWGWQRQWPAWWCWRARLRGHAPACGEHVPVNETLPVWGA